MRVQKVQSNITFGTRFSHQFIEDFERVEKHGCVKQGVIKNIKKLLADGLDDVIIATKTVDNFWSGKNKEVFYVKSDKLEQLAKIAKDDKNLYHDEQYYNALRYLKETAQIDRQNRDNSICDVKSINGQNYFLSGSNDHTSSMIFALLRQSSKNVNVSVDGENTGVAEGINNFWYRFNNEDFADKFKSIYNNVVKNFEILTQRQKILSDEVKK